MPITDYFENYLPRGEERNQAFRDKLDKEQMQRQKAAIKDAEDNYCLRRLTKDDAYNFLKLHLKGYSNAEISWMLTVPKGNVFRMLQPLLACYLAGARGKKVLRKNKNYRLFPNPAAILKAIEKRGETVETFAAKMMSAGISRQAVNRLLGVRRQRVSIEAALKVAEYFERNIDEYFLYAEEEEKEK